MRATIFGAAAAVNSELSRESPGQIVAEGNGSRSGPSWPVFGGLEPLAQTPPAVGFRSGARSDQGARRGLSRRTQGRDEAVRGRGIWESFSVNAPYLTKA